MSVTDAKFKVCSRIAALLSPGAVLERVVRLTGGVSAEVHRLDLKLHDGSTSRVVLRVHGAAHSGHSAELEFQLLHALYCKGMPVPKPLLVDQGGELSSDAFVVIGFVEGTSEIPAVQRDQRIDLMADTLATIHALPTADLPKLPLRCDPLPEVFDYLPAGNDWDKLIAHLHTCVDTAYVDVPTLLHGDFWPENLLWRHGAIASILDWEDAALGDPLSDLAGCGLELRYNFGRESTERLTEAYAKHRPIAYDRLALWQIYVAAAAQRFMGNWGLDAKLEAHMRTEALNSIREAGDRLMG